MVLESVAIFVSTDTIAILFSIDYTFYKEVKTMPELETIKQVVSEFADKYGADRVVLFGSYARGDMTKDSDIDLLIDKGSIRGLKFAALICDLEEALHTPVDLISTRGADEEFLNSIKKDEILLYERG